MPATSDSRYDRSSPRDRRLRVGDGEREAVGEILRQEHLDGRLDADEFQDRVERCLAAKTYADLDGLVADLPRAEAERQLPDRGRRWRPLPFGLVPLALIAAIVLSRGHLVWLAFPLVFLFVVRPLLRRSRGGGAWGCGPHRGTRPGLR